MPAEIMPSTDIEAAIAGFRAGASAASGEGLSLPGWKDDDWRQLFRFTSVRAVRSGDALIRRGELDRTLYLVLRGGLEVIGHAGDGLSMGRLASVKAGSVLGEQSFFDGGGRSASAWAVNDCAVAGLTPANYAAFAEASPTLARELIFGLGRILAMRLRRTSARVAV